MKSKIIIFFVIIFQSEIAFSKDLSELKDLLQETYYGGAGYDPDPYDRRIFPCHFEYCVVGVLLSFQPKHITGFIMETGILSLTGKLSLTWLDYNAGEHMVSSDHGSITEMFLPEDYNWLPSITVYNSVKEFKMISDPTHKARVLPLPGFDPSTIEWVTTLITDIPCAVNVKLFPFDTQECEIVFSSWGYNASEVYLYSEEETLNTAIYQPNEEWTLEAGTISNYSVNDISYLRCKMTLKRKNLWFFISMIIPVTLLSMFATFATKIPVDSGERITFLMTILLGFAFYMDMVQRVLPKTSNPMPFISYYISSMLYLCSFTVIINIFLMRIYNKDPHSTVPVVVRCFVATLTWRWCCPKQIKPDPDLLQPIETEVTNPIETITLSPMEKIDWRTTGIALDIFFFYVFFIIQFICSMIFLLPLVTGGIYTV